MSPCPKVRDVENSAGITWNELTDQEPQLQELLWQARGASVSCRRWSDVERTFAPIRNALTELVGFNGRKYWDPVLGSSMAYQVAYWKLFDAVAGLLTIRAGSSPEQSPETRAETFVVVTGVNGWEPNEAAAAQGLAVVLQPQ
jgi:hypothetical protein